MRALAQSALTISLAAALLVSCGESQAPVAAPDFSSAQSAGRTVTGHYLYVTNGGSQDVSTFAINARNGALRQVKGSPFAAAIGPVAVAIDPTQVRRPVK